MHWFSFVLCLQKREGTTNATFQKHWNESFIFSFLFFFLFQLLNFHEGCQLYSLQEKMQEKVQPAESSVLPHFPPCCYPFLNFHQFHQPDEMQPHSTLQEKV